MRSASGNVDFRLITVHLYWSEAEARFQEAKQLNTWIESYLGDSDQDPDVLIIGDFNTKPLGAQEIGESQTIISLEMGKILTCVSEDHPEYTTPTTEERYDHAFLSKSLLDEEYLAESWDVRREAAEAFPVQFERDLSNHVPVTLRVSDESRRTWTAIQETQANGEIETGSAWHENFGWVFSAGITKRDQSPESGTHALGPGEPAAVPPLFPILDHPLVSLDQADAGRPVQFCREPPHLEPGPPRISHH